MVKKGRVTCTCVHNGVITEVIKMKPKATTAQMLRAAGIGAGSVTAAMTIATVIYIFVSRMTTKNRKVSESNETYERSRKKSLPRSR